MSDPTDQLREAFTTHEDLAPDPAEVYARVQELAHTYRRRRRGAQAAGGAVLGAGLIAGAISLPGLLPSGQPELTTAMSPVATSSATPSSTASTTPTASAVPTASASSGAPRPTASATLPTGDERERQWAAYFAAGYGYDDALKLAELWHRTDDVGVIKAEAGRRLLAGETLPIPPSEDPEPDPTTDPAERARVQAFFDRGYDYDDAVTLAGLWHTADPYQAKVEAGRRLLAGETLPIQP